MKAFVFLGVLLVVGGAFFYFKGGLNTLPFYSPPMKTVTEFTTEGDEPPDPDGASVHRNGFNIRNHPGPAKILDTWRTFEPWLGEPLSTFDGRSQMFAFGRLTVTPSNPPGWVIEFDNLGRIDMMREGLSPQPGSTPHRALQAYLVEEAERGTDGPRIFGPVISKPVCARGVCSQWTQRARFSFPEAATSADHVSRMPLGLWLTYPRTRQIQVPDDNPSTWSPAWLLFLLVGVAALVGSLFRRGGGGSVGRSRTV